MSGPSGEAAETVELADVMFAVDSIPAVFAVTRDPFIVFTSNIFAILGLRALYFLLAGSLTRLRFLNVGLAGVLVFVGGKMLVSGVAPIPIGVSLAFVAILLGAATAASVMCRERPTQAPAEIEGAGLPSLDSRAT